MSEPSPTRTLAEEGARASRAINDTIKRLTAASGANPLMDGFPNYLQAAQEYNAKMLEYTVATRWRCSSMFGSCQKRKQLPSWSS